MPIALHVTLFLNCSSELSDQSLAESAEVETTAISTPLDRVPLYSMHSDEEPITLMKSSHAVWSSVLPREGTPVHKVPQIYQLKLFLEKKNLVVISILKTQIIGNSDAMCSSHKLQSFR